MRGTFGRFWLSRLRLGLGAHFDLGKQTWRQQTLIETSAFLPFEAEREIEKSDNVTFPRTRIWGIVESVDINPIGHYTGKPRL